MNFWVIVKKNLMKEVKKKTLYAKLERHLARSHALLHEISAYIYIYIYIDDYSFITPNH